MKIKYLVLVFIFSFQSLTAWGKTGHRIVGKIAETLLTENAKMQIKKLIGHHDISRISNWADEIKSDPQWSHAWDWHYCTIPDGEDYEPGKHKGQAIEKIKEFIQTLKNPKSTKEEKQIALKFLVHLIEDLHQPLHVGNGKDKGGNSTNVNWFGALTNLHTVWDTKLIDHQNLSYTEYADYLMLDLNYSKIQKWQGDNVMEYIYESKNFRSHCYDYTGENLKWEYVYKNKDLIELRLLQGGARLSGELNRIFK